MNKKMSFDKHKIILKVALEVNKKLFDNGKISYRMYKYTEDKLLKEFELE